MMGTATPSADGHHIQQWCLDRYGSVRHQRLGDIVGWGSPRTKWLRGRAVYKWARMDRVVVGGVVVRHSFVDSKIFGLWWGSQGTMSSC